jgi:HPt (histidine-containing phosphotransfer) domain-containing protein
VTTTNLAFLAFLEQQRAEYRALLPERLLQIESLWRQVLSGAEPGDALATLERCAHSLAGSGATFGFAALGDAARLLELTINPMLDSPHTLTPESRAVLNQAIQALQCSFADAS